MAEQTSGIQPKRPRMDCIIHCSDDDSNLVAPQNISSWNTLLRSAEIRGCTLILDLAKDLPDGKVPSVLYHRKCRSLFMMKKDLDRIIAIESSAESSLTEDVRKYNRQSPQPSRVYETKCIFCDKCSKYLKGQDRKEGLTRCTELRADETIRRVAVMKGDTKLLATVSRELVAAEGQYHRSCYRLYTKDLTYTDMAGDENMMDISESPYDDAEKTALCKMFTYVREGLIENPTVVPFRDIVNNFVEEMANCGITQVTPSTKKHLRRKLEAEFGTTLHFIQNNNSKLLVYPDNLSMENFVKVFQDLKDELNVYKSGSNKDNISKVALNIRDDIRNQHITQAWPPHAADLENMKIAPPSLEQFFYTLLAGTSTAGNPSKRVQRLTASFSQDIVYAVTSGKVKPAKHIVLPFAVKSLTGNVELIQILNRLGHGISYSQVEEIDTALCLQKQAASEDGIPLPQNIKPGQFTTLAWDNIDRLEETISGEGTSHRVNGIVVQAKSIADCHVETRNLPCIPKTKKRSIGAEELVLPIYNAGARANPPAVLTLDTDHSVCLHDSVNRNHMWLMARLSNDVCSWTGFNILTHSNSIVQEDSIGYLPTINAPATQLSTVNEILHQSIRIMKTLHLKNIVVVFDQALYAKAAEVTWKHHELFKDIILRMGAFHTTCTFMATIGKRFADAGLRDLCVEAGVIADGSISGVIDGHRYNRAVRLHKLLYEAFLRLAWKGFRPWIEEKHQGDIMNFEATLQAVDSLCEEVSQTQFEETLQEESCQRILTLFNEYLSFLRVNNGPLSAFWMSYVDMVEVMLGLLRASREGNWMLHLAAIRNIIPWCFAYDRLNYARYLTYYYAQMSRLEVDHPDVHAHFVKGGFSVQLGKNNPFGKIPVDQTIEETVNKDTQTAGGTKGFSLKPGAVTRYYMTSENRSQYLRQLRNMTGNESSDCFSHQDLQGPRIKKDLEDVNAFVDLMENSWVNPLCLDHSDIISLSTGISVSPEIASDLLQANQTGEKAYVTFRSERFENESPTSKFHDKMKKLNLKSFSTIKKSDSIGKVQSKEVILKADRNLFGHMIIAAQSRNLNIYDVLSHPLGPLPWALSNPDGSLRKTNKASLARELEKLATSVEDIGQHSACIIDGMSLIQRMKGDGKTFGEIADSVLNLALHEGGHSKRIDMVFDVYLKTSIKNAERGNRGSASSTQWKNIAPGHSVMQWRKLLSNADSKTALITFIVDQWKLPVNRAKLQDKQVFATCGNTCYLISREHYEVVEQLKSSQEEADTRMLLHAKHASQSGYQPVVIVSEDTDVMILSLGYCKMIQCPLYQKCGTQNRTRYINISSLAKTLGEDLCDALVAVHAFTGCDSVSAFAGRGKLSALKLVRGNMEFKEAFKSMGTSWEVSDELHSKMETFVCRLYAPSTNVSDVKDMRYLLFCTKRGGVDSSLLPPCRDCLQLHTKRANYQTAVWRHCLEAQPDLPDPTGNGWIKDDNGMLVIDWMQGPPAPMAVLELMACMCVRTCKLPDCSCLSNKLKCTEMCKLQTCSNQREEDDGEAVVELLSYTDRVDDDDE